MFKIEPYITPILLSYFDKYIKNFKLEDSQVSLWDGDASFHNLELRLQVLEQELNSPFSFVSGHIQELLIHVPWTKLTSEPITITINTIECVLKLKGADDNVHSETVKLKRPPRQDLKTPPNYIQFLLNKIISNIRIICNNLILKYVEEDIVLSMNIKHLKYESANINWEAAFTDVSSNQIVIRKIITVNDLTICLDKRNSSGKIDVYQEPMLYRCSMVMYLLKTYYSATANRASITRLDVYCNNMEFSMTEQQIPMLLRLIYLLIALQQNQLTSESHSQTDNLNVSSESPDTYENSASWSGWAWSMVSSVFPSQWDETLDEQQMSQSEHIVHCGFYVDNASITFKVSDLNYDKGNYSQKKIRYCPLLMLQLQGMYCECLMYGAKWFNTTFGVSEAIIIPIGNCSCGYSEITESQTDIYYLKIGSKSLKHKTDSLFDKDAVENKGQSRVYNTSWDFHMITNIETIFLDRTPAIAFDYVFDLEIPDEDSESSYDSVNTQGKTSLRLYIGTSKLLYCSGLNHRIDCLKVAASNYDYAPYSTPKPELSLAELTPPSIEDFDTLSQFISIKTIRIMLFNPVVELQLPDHPYFMSSKEILFLKSKKLTKKITSKLHLYKLPKVIIECKSLDLTITKPLYINHVVHTTCQLPNPPEQMFNACFNKWDINIMGLSSRLIFNQNSHTNIIVPFNLSYKSKTILLPQYWINPDIPHNEMVFESENVTFNCTKAKMLLVFHIISKVLKIRTSEAITMFDTSLFIDAFQEQDAPFMELYIENIRLKMVTTNSTNSIDLCVGSVKAFLIESTDQVLIVSGPELQAKTEDLYLFTATLQYSLKPDVQIHPSMLIFNLYCLKISLDPLFFKWFLYFPVKLTQKSDLDTESTILKSRKKSETVSDVNKRVQRIQSVHSSSDREMVQTTHESLKIKNSDESRFEFSEFLKKWYNVFKTVILIGNVTDCTIFFPINSISAIGSQGILQVIEENFNKNNSFKALIISLPSISVYNSQKTAIYKYLQHLPVKLPAEIWTAEKFTFPWTIDLFDFLCYTLQNNKKYDFLKPLSFSASVALSKKKLQKNVQEEIDTIDIHIDMAPVSINIKDEQICLLTGILCSLTELYHYLYLIETKETETVPIVTEINTNLSSTPIDENTWDSISDEKNISLDNVDLDIDKSYFKLTAWFQLTITRLTINILCNNLVNSQLKLVIDFEDIVNSLDFQHIYWKFKSKIGSMTIQHFKLCENNWQNGCFSGFVMKQRDDVFILKDRHEGLINITMTRANSQHTHTLWGAVQKRKKSKIPITDIQLRCITEIVVNVQPIDFIIPLSTLSNFYSILSPLLQIGQKTVTKKKDSNPFKNLNSQMLPLIHLDCQDIRIIFPSEKLTKNNSSQDVCLIQISKIALNPSAVNPICRTPIRSDIYQRAAQLRILNVPGSEIEDRQYQFDMLKISIATTNWKEIKQILNEKTIPNVWGISENPALEWNNLKQGQHSINPIFNVETIVDKFDISVVLAPAIVYNKNVIVCGCSLENNFVTDLQIYLSLEQIELITDLFRECSDSENSVKRQYEIEQINIQFPQANIKVIQEDNVDFCRDSGLDSDISILSTKTRFQPNVGNTSEFLSKIPKREVKQSNFVPVEILLTAGKLTCTIYESMKKNDDNLDEKYIPLLFTCLSQPNIFVSIYQVEQKVHASCFDICMKIANDLKLSKFPTEEDFLINLLETRPGIPNPTSDISPAFLNVKYNENIGKCPNVSVEILKPLKINFSLSIWHYLFNIKQKIIKETKQNTSVSSENQRFTFNTYKVNNINVAVEQLLFSFKTANDMEACLVFAKLTNNLSVFSWQEKYQNSLKFQSISLAITTENHTKLMLNPWTLSINVTLFWESWQCTDSYPQIQVSIVSDCIMLDINPRQIFCIETILEEFNKILFTCNFNNRKIKTTLPQSVERDQHYKDDLRAGAFQYIDANEDGPLPYQVIFSNTQHYTMTWRYPQPRALTKVRVFPVPFKPDNLFEDFQVLCQLEYWSDCLGRFLPYSQFYLSEMEVCHLNLPKTKPERAVASIWRVIMEPVVSDESKSDLNISPRALAACMRIDSYFSKSLIPTLTAKIYIEKINVALYTYYSNFIVTPNCLKEYKFDEMLPTYQNFLTITWNILQVYLAKWTSDVLTFDMTSTMTSSVLDYGFLTEQTVIEPFFSSIEVNFSDIVEFNFISNDIQVNFGPYIAHTLAVSAELWKENLKSLKNEECDLIILTKYVICNDTNMKIRFGQVSTDEEILLCVRQFHMYCWRSQKQKRQLKVAVNNEWSMPFSIDTVGSQTVKIVSSNLNLIITVVPLSVTQKQIIISAQLIISNMLAECFEFKVVKSVEENREKEIKNTPVYILNGKSVAPSIFIDKNKSYFLRLRFSGLESAWTGDIPLKKPVKNSQPWLVKVPLQEKGQFLSIWCKIIVQELKDGNKILATLWPLFSVRSHLPIASPIHIETPNLNVNVNSVIGGKGKFEQLYCPGTIDYSDQLTFILNNNSSITNTYVPLSYSLVNDLNLSKKTDKFDIDEIVRVLKDFDQSKWPYFDEELDCIDWIVGEQPLTTIEVHHQSACLYTNALVVELLPWCLMLNVLGCEISLKINDSELFRVPQHGIVAPPKLDDNFNLGICITNKWYYSNPLQITKSDWGQTFYMPKISGNLPLEGNITTNIDYESNTCLVSLTSKLSHNIRLIKISSTHVFCNRSSFQVEIVCYAVPDSDKLFSVPENCKNYSFTVASNMEQNNCGLPITQWYVIDKKETSNCDYALYMSFSSNSSDWSCPIRVDKSFTRKSFSVWSENTSIPLLLICQEYRNQIYLFLYYDNYPQIQIKNKTETNLYFAQFLEDDIKGEAEHFDWFNKIKIGQKVYYTMPFSGRKYPELPQSNLLSENIVFSCNSDKNFKWSFPVNITCDLEQFIRIPFYGDIKIKIKNTAFTTLILLESVSEVEISAKEIRGRLSMHEIEQTSIINKKSEEISEFLQETNSNTSYNLLFLRTIPSKNNVEMSVFIKSFKILFIGDDHMNEYFETAMFTCDLIALRGIQSESLNVDICIADIQLDNQMYLRDSFDFPVVLTSQKCHLRENLNIFRMSIASLIDLTRTNCLLYVNMDVETWFDDLKNKRATGLKNINVTLNPLSCYIEDLFINKLMEYLNNLIPTKLIVWPNKKKTVFINCKYDVVPQEVSLQAELLSKPININNFVVEPIYLLLSVHCSVKLYIALDQSPLQFGRFEKKRLLTTSYRLGHSLTMHYLSGAIFGAGWVVSSLELIGSPGGLARAMGVGLRDFISLPYRGLIEGPWAFLLGITHGSASLMKHLTAGTLQSVTKLASSVARNLDRLTMDQEHLKRAEEQRRQKPQGLTDGLKQGLTGLGISLLGAVGGIAHHPIQSIMADGASPKSLAAGVGLGLVGVITKPLSGAAEFVALTGQGLLQGAGWSTLPEPKIKAVLNEIRNGRNAILKFPWKLIKTNKNVLYAIEATCINLSDDVYLILTVDAVIVVDIKDDIANKIISLNELTVIEDDNDPTLVSFKLSSNFEQKVDEIIEMDPVSRARVVNYVKSTVDYIQSLKDARNDHSHNASPTSEHETLTYFVNPQCKNYFLTLIAILKEQNDNYNFPVL